MSTEIKTYKDLKDWINTLTDEQLSFPATIENGDEPVSRIVNAGIYEEDMFRSDYYLEPISSFEPHFDGDVLEESEIVVKKGQPYFVSVPNDSL